MKRSTFGTFSKCLRIVHKMEQKRKFSYCMLPPNTNVYQCMLQVLMSPKHATPVKRHFDQVRWQCSASSLPASIQQIIGRIAMNSRERPLKLDSSSVYLKFSANELSSFSSSYYLLNMTEKLNLALSLAETNTPVDTKLIKNLESALKMFEQTSHEREKADETRLKGMLVIRQKLQDMLTPAYRQLFLELGRLPHGVKLIVHMRADILDLMLSGDLPNNERAYYRLKELDAVLKDILSHWFSTGLLEVKRVTWQTSPSAMLERIATGELVHPVKNWIDLKKRVESDDRLCFAFCHPSMGDGEPIVSLFCALCPDVPRNVAQVIESRANNDGRHDLNFVEENRLEAQSRPSPDPNPACAIFYSINSLQPGLKGIELGSHLIKAAVRLLRQDMPQLTTFATLSPIPGFRSWLLHQLNIGIAGQQRRSLAVENIFLDEPIMHEIIGAARQEPTLDMPLPTEPADILKFVRQVLRHNSWFMSSDNLRTVFRKPLLLAAEHYLLREKLRTFALCPVAHFHLSNGAELLQLNFLADTTPKRLNQSFGIMANYHYVIAKSNPADSRYSHAELILEQNSADYLQKCAIVVNERFKENTFGDAA